MIANETINDLPQFIHDDQNGLDYALHGDYYFPDLGKDSAPMIGKYGIARKQFLMDFRQEQYDELMQAGTLNDDLLQAESDARRFLDVMLPQMVKAAGITEEMKQADQFGWIGAMNALKNQAEEYIWDEIIYR